MDLRHYRNFCRRILGVFSRTPALSERYLRIRRYTFGLTVLLLSLGLGFKAQQIARAQAEADWHRENYPTPEVWTYGLGQRGYLPLHSAEDTRRLSKELPPTWESRGTAWVSTDAQWICLMPREGESSARYFSYGAKIPKKPKKGSFPAPHWQWVGSGWPGFQELFARLDKMPKPREQVPARKIARDSRLLVY